MPTCFVVMGFGKKTDLATGRELDLDKTYKNIIKPAVQEAGYICERADEILHSGMIDKPMYERLLDADLVVADLSTSNLNAMFELGVRHALKPRSTIILAESKFVSPFDVNHIVIRKYEHLGTDIGFDEVMRMRAALKDLMVAIGGNSTPDSPIYTLMPTLRAPGLPDSADATGTPAAELVQASPPSVAPQDSYGARMDEALAAKDKSDFARAKAILLEVYNAQRAPPDGGGEARSARPRVVQELALATYKAGEKAAGGSSLMLEAAYGEAIDLLRQLDPESTTDPETLGLWSSVHKRRSDLPGRADYLRRQDLDTAIYASERGFLIRQDYYNGGNLAYLLDLRASLSSGDEKTADRVHAQRVRRRVAAAAQKEISSLDIILKNDAAERNADLREREYWALASLAEALIGLDDPSGEQALAKAEACAKASWMVDTTKKQITQLKALRAT